MTDWNQWQSGKRIRPNSIRITKQYYDLRKENYFSDTFKENKELKCTVIADCENNGMIYTIT